MPVREPRFIEVDPRTLRLPNSRRTGTDPYKLQRQIARFGTSISGMPPVWVTRGKDGVLRIDDGVTRATRIAKLSPGTLIPVKVVDELLSVDFTVLPTIEKMLP